MSHSNNFERNAFVNCPFDKEYEPLLQAILFTLVRFGLRPRISSETNDSGESRLERILELIQSSRFAIHDLSRFKAKQEGEIYRMNMPFELGLDIGCRRFGSGRLARKRTLVLEEQRYQYQKSLSDLAGCDIDAHDGDFMIAVRKVRNWFSGIGGFEEVAAARVLADYEDFQHWHLRQQKGIGSSEDDISDYSTSELLRSMFKWSRERES